MSKSRLSLELSASYLSDAPTIELYINGVAVSSATVTAQTGVGLDLVYFDFEYDGALPASVNLMFNDGLSEMGRSISIDALRINGIIMSTDHLGSTLLSQYQSSALNLSDTSYAFGQNEPSMADIDTIDIIGTAAADTLRGSNDNVTFAGDGNDSITAGSGNNLVVGEDGNDFINADAGDDVVYGSAGSDTITGGSGRDVINGGANDDWLTGDEGNDIIYGGTGNDNLSGDEGDDYLLGGGGDDLLIGGSGDDILYGGDGNDRFDGGTGTNTYYGGAGDDIIYSRTASEILYGGDDNDMMIGANGTAMYGEAGNDALYANNDNLLQTEIDTILAANPNVFYLDESGSFYQHVTATANWATANLAAQTSFLNGQSGHLVHIETAAENTALTTALGGSAAWIGASDELVEDEWLWTGGGTLNGTQFSLDAAAVGNHYNNWDAGQPANDFSFWFWNFVYDHAYIQGDGTWASSFATTNRDYVIEWEGHALLTGGIQTVMSGGDGADTLYGGDGQDNFVFLASETGTGIDTIDNFQMADMDTIDLSDILSGFNPSSDDINDFVNIQQSGSNGILQVDASGSGSSFTSIATITDGANYTADILYGMNALIV